MQIRFEEGKTQVAVKLYQDAIRCGAQFGFEMCTLSLKVIAGSLFCRSDPRDADLRYNFGCILASASARAGKTFQIKPVSVSYLKEFAKRCASIREVQALTTRHMRRY